MFLVLLDLSCQMLLNEGTIINFCSCLPLDQTCFLLNKVISVGVNKPNGEAGWPDPDGQCGRVICTSWKNGLLVIPSTLCASPK